MRRYASVCAMESPTKVDDEQWLSYWIIYSFITLLELVAERILYWIPIWYPVKLLFVAWLVLPQFKGASFIYEKLVREQLKDLCRVVVGAVRLENRPFREGSHADEDHLVSTGRKIGSCRDRHRSRHRGHRRSLIAASRCSRQGRACVVADCRRRRASGDSEGKNRQPRQGSASFHNPLTIDANQPVPDLSQRCR